MVLKVICVILILVLFLIVFLYIPMNALCYFSLFFLFIFFILSRIRWAFKYSSFFFFLCHISPSSSFSSCLQSSLAQFFLFNSSSSSSLSSSVSITLSDLIFSLNCVKVFYAHTHAHKFKPFFHPFPFFIVSSPALFPLQRTTTRNLPPTHAHTNKHTHTRRASLQQCL